MYSDWLCTAIGCLRTRAALPCLCVWVCAELLSDPDALRNASLSPLGNLGVQRIFEAMAKLRLAFPPERPNKDLQEFKVAHGGKDPFGED